MNTNNINTTEFNFDKFIGKLKKQDSKIKKLYLVLVILYVIFIAFTIPSTILTILHKKSTINIFSSIGVLISFIIFFILVLKKYREYKSLDYSISTYALLKKIGKRYKLFSKEDDIISIIALVILIFSLSLNHIENIRLFIIQNTLILIFFTIIGFIYWYKKLKPIKDKASELIKELEN